MKRVQFMGMVAVLTLIVGACYTTGPATTVQRVDPNAQIDLSGEWNDTDANQVAHAMIQDCLARPWAANYKAEKGKTPVIRLYPIKKRTAEHIDEMFFTKQVEREILNSGIASVVSSLVEAGDNRLERMDQAHNAGDSTIKSQQNETGSDFILNGWIITQNDRNPEGLTVRAYIITMELSNSETNQKVWIGEKKIKKVVQQAPTQW